MSAKGPGYAGAKVIIRIANYAQWKCNEFSTIIHPVDRQMNVRIERRKSSPFCKRSPLRGDVVTVDFPPVPQRSEIIRCLQSDSHRSPITFESRQSLENSSDVVGNPIRKRFS